MTVYFLLIKKECENMETLYSKIKKLEKIQQEKYKIDKLILKYVNRKDVKKLILKGLKKETSLITNIDGKEIKLYREFVYPEEANNYCVYKFTIIQNKTDIFKMQIKPSFFNFHLKLKVYKFEKKLISYDKALDYLKLTIGIK